MSALIAPQLHDLRGAERHPREDAFKTNAAATNAASPDSAFTVRSVSGKDALALHGAAIADLATRALEPNPFYEPWMLAGVLDNVVGSANLWFLLIYKNEPSSSSAQLCGFFPVMPLTRHHGLPVRSFRIAGHTYCFLGVPLIDRDTASAVLLQFFAACRSFGAALVEFPKLPSGGRFHQVLVDVVHQQRFASWIETRYLRALYRRPASPEEYLAESLSGKTRKHVRRQRERLGALGALEYCTLESAGDPEAWLREFLELEASGWKGKERSALASSPAHVQFFIEAGTRALERKAIFGAALRLDKRMIAGRVLFRASEGSFLFKIAYDEQLAAFSPGTLLELQTIEHGLPDGVAWTDSCTSATNNVFRRLWLHSRIIEDVVVSPASLRGDLAIGLVPLLRWIKSRTRRTARREKTSGPDSHSAA